MALELSQLKPVEALTLRDHIKQQILDVILNGTFMPGERLIESAIADQLGVSRAPVREALSALECEGIVVNVSRRGYFVTDFTDKDIEEIYSLRLILEIGALHRAIDRFTEQDIDRLQQIIDDIGQEIRQGADLRKTVAKDLSFHEQIFLAADHSRLYAAWNSICLQIYLLIGLASATRFDYPDESRESHQRILDAIAARDLKRTEARLSEHILDAQQRARMALETLRSSTPKD
jgi:DNA-binding GntR family transcriptional regulator